ncbi:pancreatic triacylglycerol lipase [Trichonephila clavata]|uniref:Pancreatic triacylglycerol lipase n=1 Tax=Trichonephila clavata TaxID=2740835 RepID=A0A8X6KYL4_TRICU|nr:pancreatic triacylglycerol lipase [Trichonephila clavata]
MLWIFIISVLVGQARLDVIKRDVKSFFTREKCIDGLGCFNAGAPFFNFLERPLSLLPDEREEINTRFILYTREYAKVPMNFSNLDKSMDYLPRSNFNPSFKTKFIVPGYVSKVAPHWKMPLKDALLASEPCNVFYVDWSGGDGNLYEQAVANTRVVGAEIAVFIQELQKRTGIKPESVHIIGHSLGSHIAGYAGKRLKSLGRITAMDPAGPYFTNVEPIVRLDRADALFVDAIHTNAAPSRFQGFGLVDSIAHFDFFPNGGHLQPGCQDMGQAILAFLSHPSFDADGLHDLICNHGRAIDFFISSIMNSDCQLLGAQCESWEDFVEGKCGNCNTGQGQLCVPLGINSIRFANHIQKDKSLNFYLNTTDTEPYCIH